MYRFIESSKISHKSRRLGRGFTVIELLVVIVVIGILASLILINYSGYIKKATESQLKTDLLAAATEMRKQQSQTGNFPTNISSTSFSPNKGIQVTGGSSDGTTFCLLGSTSKYSDLKFYIDQTSSSPTSGDSCPGGSGGGGSGGCPDTPSQPLVISGNESLMYYGYGGNGTVDDSYQIAGGKGPYSWSADVQGRGSDIDVTLSPGPSCTLINFHADLYIPNNFTVDLHVTDAIGSTQTKTIYIVNSQD